MRTVRFRAALGIARADHVGGWRGSAVERTSCRRLVCHLRQRYGAFARLLLTHPRFRCLPPRCMADGRRCRRGRRGRSPPGMTVPPFWRCAPPNRMVIRVRGSGAIARPGLRARVTRLLADEGAPSFDEAACASSMARAVVERCARMVVRSLSSDRPACWRMRGLAAADRIVEHVVRASASWPHPPGCEVGTPAPSRASPGVTRH